MATKKITNTELLDFINAAQNYINRNPDRTKLHYALEKTLKKTTALFEDYADAENEVRVDCALIDEKTKTFALGEDKRSYVIDPAKAKELQKSLRELGRKEIEIETHFATELPPFLEAMWYQYFNGIVLDEKNDPALSESKLDPQAIKPD